ncbi:MAG: cation-transporting P-type ATPase [Candidatus Lokiarchaeota archaeon]|nr:cation-transporting P-type ATPase [Candidatus Lokiarchaeota archaeon]
MEEIYYNMELEQIYEKFETNSTSGLTNEEAQKRLELYGLNEIPKASKGFIKIYLAPLFNWLIVIYLVGVLILFLAAIFDGNGDIIFILVTLGVVALNCFVAIIQQYRATKKLNALREMTAPTTTIIRNGQKTDILTNSVVVGDLLVLKQGDRVPADGRIVQGSNLEANESSLTGESEPVRKNLEGAGLTKKDISIAERHNMIFYGTFITTGNATAIAVKTGKDTEIGKISQGLDDAGTSDIPIRKKMNNFGKWLGLIVIGFWLFIILIVWFATGVIDVVKSLTSALDLLPINIPLLVTIILLTGVLAMAHHGVIIRNIASVDSLGRVSVVCSDKTGTLTKNQMSIQHVWTNGSNYKVTGSGYSPEGDIILVDDPKNSVMVKHIDDFPQLKLLLTSGFLNNNSALVKNEVVVSGKVIPNWNVIGSPTEGALMVLFQKGMGDYLLEDFEYIKEHPFDSKVKRMTKIYKKDGKFYSFTKGASEILMPLCKKVLYKDQELDLNEEIKEKIMRISDAYAEQGFRILSLCYKKLDAIPAEDDKSRELCESDMIYIGFVTILDPPREGVKQSVEQCHDAGVDVVMITGDSVKTARAIAKQIAIIKSNDEIVVEGKDIKNVKSFYDFSKIKVFARVSPEHKQVIIEKYQDANQVVAMTGDGVNDALALNMADAGIAMGIQGTDVSKEASDMVITDDSFTSIVTGIEQGRGIFSRIRAVVFFYICINVFEGIVQFILSVILNLPYFLDDAFYYQWIFLSITLHIFPGLILTFDRTSKDVMKQKPHDEEEILSKNTVILLFIFGALLAVSMIVVYFTTLLGPEVSIINFGDLNEGYLFSPITFPDGSGITLNEAKTLTMLMATLFFCESFLILQIRRPNKSLIKSIKEDSTRFMYLLIGFLFAVFLALIYIPGVQVTLADWGLNFRFMFLTGWDWLVCFLISLICIVSFELVKYFARRSGIFF